MTSCLLPFLFLSWHQLIPLFELIHVSSQHGGKQERQHRPTNNTKQHHRSVTRSDHTEEMEAVQDDAQNEV